jgi:hypothetical protein
VGNATARAIEFRSRDEGTFFYPGKAWYSMANPDGSYLWLRNGALNLGARVMMFYVLENFSVLLRKSRTALLQDKELRETLQVPSRLGRQAKAATCAVVLT